ncbi:DUF6247 family protein [Nonomuraea sp. NPDC050680]|uniref:DUF6247 family protein n=1 Tax=Nonomuraea sp. NPDC050680 TaxID=3154630 RepID=UPI0033D2D456
MAEAHDLHRTPEEIRASLKSDRSPKNIRAALPPKDRAMFDREYWRALDKAKLNYDLAPIQSFQDSWWWTAYQKAAPYECAETIQAAERALKYLERGESPPGAVRVDDTYKARMRQRGD